MKPVRHHNYDYKQAEYKAVLLVSIHTRVLSCYSGILHPPSKYDPLLSHTSLIHGTSGDIIIKSYRVVFKLNYVRIKGNGAINRMLRRRRRYAPRDVSSDTPMRYRPDRSPLRPRRPPQTVS